LPKWLECFHDYKEGLAYAKELNKPVLLDFTGHACVNCRKMEEQVWTDPKIDKIIRNNYVLISLHVDDKRDLPEEDQFVNDKGEVIETIGGKWMELQISRYGTATQPYYRLVDFEGKDLTNEERSFDTDVNVYADFLNNGIKSFNTKHQ
jgi:thiol:disulfide interchange protein DsbD